MAEQGLSKIKCTLAPEEEEEVRVNAEIVSMIEQGTLDLKAHPGCIAVTASMDASRSSSLRSHLLRQEWSARLCALPWFSADAMRSLGLDLSETKEVPEFEMAPGLIWKKSALAWKDGDRVGLGVWLAKENESTRAMRKIAQVWSMGVHDLAKRSLTPTPISLLYLDRGDVLYIDDLARAHPAFVQQKSKWIALMQKAKFFTPKHEATKACFVLLCSNKLAKYARESVDRLLTERGVLEADGDEQTLQKSIRESQFVSSLLEMMEREEWSRPLLEVLKTAMEKESPTEVLSKTENDFVLLFPANWADSARNVFLFWVVESILQPNEKRRLEKCGKDGHLRLNAFVRPKRYRRGLFPRRWSWDELRRAVEEERQSFEQTTHVHFKASYFDAQDLEELVRFVRMFPKLKWITLAADGVWESVAVDEMAQRLKEIDIELEFEEKSKFPQCNAAITTKS